MQSSIPLPKLAEVTVDIGPFDENLTNKMIRVFAVNEEDPTDKTEVSDSNGIPGQAKDAEYSIPCDISGLTDNVEYRFVSYTDIVGTQRVTLLPNPDTPNPFRFTPFDPDGD